MLVFTDPNFLSRFCQNRRLLTIRLQDCAQLLDLGVEVVEVLLMTGR